MLKGLGLFLAVLNIVIFKIFAGKEAVYLKVLSFGYDLLDFHEHHHWYRH